MISARKTKQLDATTKFTYSHANTPVGQSERAYYLSYFINNDTKTLMVRLLSHSLDSYPTHLLHTRRISNDETVLYNDRDTNGKNNKPSTRFIGDTRPTYC